MFSLYARLAVAAAIALALAGTHWKAYTKGRDVVRAEWALDAAERTQAALAASEAARKVEQELSAKVGRIDRAYQDQKRSTAHVAAAVGIGMQQLETIIASATAASASAADASGIAGADPRPTIARECVRQLGALDEAYGKLADKARALQEVSGIMCVKP